MWVTLDKVGKLMEAPFPPLQPGEHGTFQSTYSEAFKSVLIASTKQKYLINYHQLRKRLMNLTTDFCPLKHQVIGALNVALFSF
jgi:hypothetical protein